MIRFAIAMMVLAIGGGGCGDPVPEPDARTTDAPTSDAAGVLALGDPCTTGRECESGECTDL